MCKNQFKVRSYPTVVMLSTRYDMTAQWDVTSDMEGTHHPRLHPWASPLRPHL